MDYLRRLFRRVLGKGGKLGIEFGITGESRFCRKRTVVIYTNHGITRHCTAPVKFDMTSEY